MEGNPDGSMNTFTGSLMKADYRKQVKALSRLMLKSKTPAENPAFDWSATEQ